MAVFQKVSKFWHSERFSTLNSSFVHSLSHDFFQKSRNLYNFQSNRKWARNRNNCVWSRSRRSWSERRRRTFNTDVTSINSRLFIKFIFLWSFFVIFPLITLYFPDRKPWAHVWRSIIKLIKSFLENRLWVNGGYSEFKFWNDEIFKF